MPLNLGGSNSGLSPGSGLQPAQAAQVATNPQVLGAAGAINLTARSTVLNLGVNIGNTQASTAFTLAAGTVGGQRKTISSGQNTNPLNIAVVTVTDGSGFSTLIFSALEQSVELEWDAANTVWRIMGMSNTWLTPSSGITGPGAIDVEARTTFINASGVADALTLGNGLVNGQRKTLVAYTGYTGGNTSVITPAAPRGFSTITFTAGTAKTGTSVELEWQNGGWDLVALTGATPATIA